MINAWGDEFRPAFQRLAATRRGLLRNCTDSPFTTVLMSATLTDYNLHTLQDLFGAPGPFLHTHAVRLRPEPSYWLAPAENAKQQDDFLLDALWHLPRPTILYTTRRAAARKWERLVRDQGFARVDRVDGDTPDRDRSQTLARWMSNDIDLIVATSAFGLGVDKPDVRCVLHATLPEDVDRFYQEVGRGGRDGFSSLSIMVWTPHDRRVAARLASPTFIGAERGLRRWTAMFHSDRRVVEPNDRYVVPLDERVTLLDIDIDMDSDEHIQWNVRTLLLMHRSGLIEIEDSGEPLMDPASGRRTETVRVHILRSDHTDPVTWATLVGPRRSEFVASRKAAFGLMESLLVATTCISDTLTTAYAAGIPPVPVVRACGGCLHCRVNGREPFVGVLRARRSPEVDLPSRRIGPHLSAFLSGHMECYVLLPAEVVSYDLMPRLRFVLLWLLAEGVTNFVAAPHFLADLNDVLASSDQTTFLHRTELPRGASRSQPTAVFLDRANEPLWDAVWSGRGKRPSPTVIVLPEDARQPDHPQRRAVDVLPPFPSATLQQWEVRYNL